MEFAWRRVFPCRGVLPSALLCGPSVSPKAQGVNVIAPHCDHSGWEAGMAVPASRRIQECLPDADRDPIAPPALHREGASRQLAGLPAPGEPEAGAAPGPPPTPTREEGPRQPRSPLTRTPPAAPAATAPAAPPRAGHVAPGHAEPLSAGGADSAGPTAGPWPPADSALPGASPSLLSAPGAAVGGEAWRPVLCGPETWGLQVAPRNAVPRPGAGRLGPGF